MCKILVIPKVNDGNRKNVVAFMKGMAPLMSASNQDGLGYTALNKNGEIFGERWHENDEAFQPRDKVKAIVESNKTPPIDLEIFDGALELKPAPTYSSNWNQYHGFSRSKKTELGDYNAFGPVDLGTMVALTLHTRMATTPREFRNTHPFVRGNVSLIHNGIIRNQNELKNISSSCDSECILNEYYEQNVMASPTKIQKVAEKLSGYYACGVIVGGSTPTLDVFKDNTASLACLYIKELDAIIFTTSSTDAEKVCEKLGFSEPIEYNFKSGNLLRFDGKTGEVLTTVKFDTKGKTWNFSTNSTSYNSCGGQGTRSSCSTNRKANRMRYHRKDGKVQSYSDEVTTQGTWVENDHGGWDKLGEGGEYDS